MAQMQRIATVFGGTGFAGCQIIRQLAQEGVIVKIASRIPESGNFLKTCGAVGQVVPVYCDYKNAASVREVIKGSDYVINCVGILFQKGKRGRFTHAHVDIPATISKACADEKIKKLVHISALGCDQSQSKYAKSKLDGEQAVLANFPTATILRPSIIFGQNDNFFNMFAELARFLPILPLIGGGKTKFQPIYVGDVASIVMETIKSDHQYDGKIYELGGPDIIDFKQVYEKIFHYTGRPRKLISLPYWIVKIDAFFLSLLPKPLITPDQVESLKTDSIVQPEALDIKAFNTKPSSMDVILPTYLERYKSGGPFAEQHQAA